MGILCLSRKVRHFFLYLLQFLHTLENQNCKGYYLNSVDILLDCNSAFDINDKCFAVGSDGGEFIYYIKLNGEDIVYIFDMENSDYHNSIEAPSWQNYLGNINKVHQEIEEDDRQELERKKNKKWWQFWI